MSLKEKVVKLLAKLSLDDKYAFKALAQEVGLETAYIIWSI